MSEKEKMLNGLLYLADLDPELLEDRNRAKDLCFEFNNLKPSDEVNKRKIIKKQLSRVKVLGNGELTKKLTVKANRFSSKAVTKIENSGGKAEVI